MTIAKQLKQLFQFPFQEQPDILTLRRESHDASFVCNAEGALIGLNIRNQASLKKVRILEEWGLLEYLNISNNKNLKTLDFEIGLPNLFHLDLSDNKINALNFETGFKALKWLDASRNNLEQIQLKGDMPELRYLDLNGNKLRKISIPTIFKKLEFLYLEGNVLTNIPKEIYHGKKNCWEDVKNYFRAILESGIVLNKVAKFVFFGNGRVGKTTLSKELRTGKFDSKIKYTHGILIDDWIIRDVDFPNAFVEKMILERRKHFIETGRVLKIPKEIIFNVWDFGGQEYFHATHRLFLSNNIMYLIVWENASNHQNEEEGHFPYSYWEKNISHYADEKLTLYVQNKVKDNAEFNHKELRFKVYDRYEIGKEDYNADIKKLKNGILDQIINVEYLGNPIAKIYDDIRSELSKRKANQPYLTFSEFRKICQKVDKTTEQIMQNESDIESVTKFLHDTGSLICYRFKENKISKALDDYVFIDPKWVTKTIYQILDEKAKQQDGEFDKKHIVNTLKKHENIVQDSNLWIELMCEFELIFEKKNAPNTYIAPQFLKQECKDLSEKALTNFYAELPYQLILHYPDFLPRSIISRFTCKYGNLAKDYYWKYGIVVHKDGEKVMVNCEYDKKQISIRSTSHATELAIELFHVLRNLDNSEQLEVLISNMEDAKQLIGAVNIRRLEEQVFKGREYVYKKEKEFEIAHFTKLFSKYEVADGRGAKELFLAKAKTAKLGKEVISDNRGVRRPKETYPKEKNQKIIPLEKEIPTIKKILFLCASPTDESRLETGKEHRIIKGEMRAGGHRDKFSFLPPELAVTVTNLLRAMNAKPNIVHFSGHGLEEGILITNEANTTQVIPLNALKRLFKTHQKSIEVVFLNSCYSAKQAEEISKFDIFVIGHNLPIADPAAISFAKGFYNGLGEGKIVVDAYNDGMFVIETEYPNNAGIVEIWKNGKKMAL